MATFAALGIVEDAVVTASLLGLARMFSLAAIRPLLVRLPRQIRPNLRRSKPTVNGLT